MKLDLCLFGRAPHARMFLLLSITFGMLVGVLGVFQAREISRVINQVFLEGKTLESVSLLLAAVVLIVVLRSAFLWCGEASAGYLARRVKQAARQQLFTHIQELGPANLRDSGEASSTRTGELVNLATEGIDALDAYFSQYLPQIVLAVFIPIIILFFVFPADLLSGVVLLVTAPLMPLFMVLIGSMAENLTRKQWLGLSRMSAYFLDVLQGLTTLKIFGRSRDQIEIIKKVSDQYRQSTMSVLKVTFLSALVLELVATLSTAVVAVEIGIRLLYGRIAFEQAFFVLLLAPEFYLPLRLLGTRFHAAMAGAEAAKNINQLTELPIQLNNQEVANAKAVHPRKNSPPVISLKHVSFAYSEEAPILQQVSFDIPPGKMTALVGESGVGKTSLTWLLLRFMKPQNGEIIVDGSPLDDIPLDLWREQVAWVPQNPYLFNGTILDNIKLAKPGADQAAVMQAARLAHAHEFIDRLPRAYETRVGERGARLSSGQAQRIALARAFLKDAPLLILDEATSHLDPDLDASLQDSIRQLTHGRTVIMIAHRLSTIARADQVVRLSLGKAELVTQPAQWLATNRLPQADLALASSPDDVAHVDASIAPDLGDETHPQKILLTGRLLKVLSPFWGRILLSILLGFLTIASGVGLMAAAAYIISAAALHPSIAELQVAIVGVRFFGLSRGVFRYLERLVSHDVTFRLLARWRAWFYQALEPLAPSRLLRFHTGDLLARVIRDIASLENFYVRTVSPPLVALMVSTACVLFVGGFGTQLAWALFGFLVLAGIGLPLLVFTQSRRLGPQIIQARAQLSALWVDAIQGMPDLLIFDSTKKYSQRVAQAGEHLAQLQYRMTGVTAMHNALGSLIASIAMLAVLVLAIHQVSQGQLNAVFLGMLMLIALTSFEAMQPMTQVAQNIDANQHAAERLYELVDAKPDVISPVAPLKLPADFCIEIRDLSFQYPPWEAIEPDATFGLKDISVFLPVGKHIALLGPSGAGKTTLLNLLLRFWEYRQGEMCLGSQDIRLFNPEDIRKQIAAITQNTYLFTATIKDNLLIARPQATDDEIIQAATQAQLHDFIQSLPAGYSTWVGEQGVRLSAGERQRLAIARALLKNSPVLILDEPTANLDPATEQAVLNSIQQISRGHTTITITQRMVGLESMDEILVLQNGHIVERGRHDELFALESEYRRMWELYHQMM